MEKKDLLLSGEEYGFGNRAYFDYFFQVSKDYHCGIVLTMKTENHSEEVSSSIVPLSEEEIAKIQSYCHFIERLRPIGDDSAHHYDGYSVTLYDGETEKLRLVECYEAQKKLEQLRESIQNHHQELGSEVINSLYYQLNDKMFAVKGVQKVKTEGLSKISES